MLLLNNNVKDLQHLDRPIGSYYVLYITRTAIEAQKRIKAHQARAKCYMIIEEASNSIKSLSKLMWSLGLDTSFAPEITDMQDELYKMAEEHPIKMYNELSNKEAATLAVINRAIQKNYITKKSSGFQCRELSIGSTIDEVKKWFVSKKNAEHAQALTQLVFEEKFLIKEKIKSEEIDKTITMIEDVDKSFL